MTNGMSRIQYQAPSYEERVLSLHVNVNMCIRSGDESPRVNLCSVEGFCLMQYRMTRANRHLSFSELRSVRRGDASICFVDIGDVCSTGRSLFRISLIVDWKFRGIRRIGWWMSKRDLWCHTQRIPISIEIDYDSISYRLIEMTSVYTRVTDSMVFFHAVKQREVLLLMCLSILWWSCMRHWRESCMSMRITFDAVSE